MAYQTINGVRIKGISAAVPEQVWDNKDLELIGTPEEREKFVETIGIAKRHVSKGQTTSDLCFHAAEQLMADLEWERSSIDCLVFVTQTPDYQLPSTSSILQHRLGLPNTCFAIQISLGCSGWVYGLSVISALLGSGTLKRGLLLVGDTVTMTKSPLDKATYPLFGDAGTATALCAEEGAPELHFETGTDGKGHKAIIIEDGGYRNPVTEASFKVTHYEDGSVRNKLQSYLNGQDVFIFGITKAPRSIKALMEYAGWTAEEVDYLLLHQANKLMLQKIAKKVGVPFDKVPLSLDEFGNTSSASIPLTMLVRIREQLQSDQRLNLVACGFGVGLSWATVSFSTQNLVVSPLQIIPE